MSVISSSVPTISASEFVNPIKSTDWIPPMSVISSSVPTISASVFVKPIKSTD